MVAAFSAAPSRYGSPLGAPRLSASLQIAPLRVPRAAACVLRAAAGESDADVEVSFGRLTVREWGAGDVPAIRSLLATTGVCVCVCVFVCVCVCVFVCTYKKKYR